MQSGLDRSRPPIANLSASIQCRPPTSTSAFLNGCVTLAFRLCISYVGTLVPDSVLARTDCLSPLHPGNHTHIRAGRTSADKIRLTSPASQNHTGVVWTLSADPAVPRNGFLAPASSSGPHPRRTDITPGIVTGTDSGAYPRRAQEFIYITCLFVGFRCDDEPVPRIRAPSRDPQPRHT